MQFREPDRKERPRHPPASFSLLLTTPESIKFILCPPLQNKGACDHKPMTAFDEAAGEIIKYFMH